LLEGKGIFEFINIFTPKIRTGTNRY